MSVHNSDYNFIFSLYRQYILYSLDQTLKHLLKASILCFKKKRTVYESRLCKEKYKVCKVLCSLSFSLFKKI